MGKKTKSILKNEKKKKLQKNEYKNLEADVLDKDGILSFCSEPDSDLILCELFVKPPHFSFLTIFLFFFFCFSRSLSTKENVLKLIEYMTVIPEDVTNEQRAVKFVFFFSSSFLSFQRKHTQKKKHTKTPIDFRKSPVIFSAALSPPNTFTRKWFLTDGRMVELQCKTFSSFWIRKHGTRPCRSIRKRQRLQKRRRTSTTPTTITTTIPPLLLLMTKHPLRNKLKF